MCGLKEFEGFSWAGLSCADGGHRLVFGTLLGIVGFRLCIYRFTHLGLLESLSESCYFRLVERQKAF